MAKKSIATTLLDKRIVVSGSVRGNVHYQNVEPGDAGRIASVYLDADSTPQYSVLMDDGRLVEMYPQSFRVMSDPADDSQELRDAVHTEKYGDAMRTGRAPRFVHFYHPTGGESKYVECAPDEWNKLTREARDRRCPLDSSTCHPDWFDELYNRPSVAVTDPGSVLGEIPIV